MILKLFIWIFIGLLDFKALNASFSAECPVSYLDDFVGRISKHRDWDDHHENDFHISNCLELLAYYQSIGVDPQFWCSNSDNFQACCLTCKNYQQLVSPDECVDVAFKQDCEVKKQQGLCDMVLGNNQRVHSFCARTCDHCPQDSPYLSCRNLRPNHCQMGGKCLDVTLYNTPTVKCLCPPTRGGTYCQLENPCNSSPCKNGGTCTPSYNDSSSNGGTCSYTCKCPKGFTGSQCEIPNQCYSLYCLNGGYCRLNYVGVPYCVCPDGYYGTYCEKSIGSCNPNPCQNNGICQPTSNNDFKCICPPNYSGKTCNFYVPPTVCYRGDMDVNKCMAWKSSNLCDFIYVYQTVPIPLYCPISCGLCKDYPSCVDTNPNCPTWANFGLCDFLKQNYPGMCRLSCNCCSNSS